ncbi:asparagine synthase-related protein [Aquimarina longa]|uniref:asparagine synthase-related protein n=1 Tax=Aquimarina longa TaxID=1080221 RepID=UPI000782A7CC|nr:asparagine synthase-related protein [Aquimarina longa]
MSDFIILHKNLVCEKSEKRIIQLTNEWFMVLTSTTYSEYNSGTTKVIIIGDYIDSSEKIVEINDDDIPKLKGHFYAIVLKEEKIKVYNSFFSMLPVYYTKEELFISSSIQFIKQYINSDLTIDKKFILENLLFNYGIFNRTLYNEIHLLACHSFIELAHHKITVNKHYTITDLFVPSPKKGKKVVDDISNLFIATVKDYLPEQEFDIAFTSGFDGRTLVSCAINHCKRFKTFSFGRSENNDVKIPLANADELKVPYQYFDLGDENYILSEYYKNATEYSSSGYMGNGFIYPHFLYSTKKVAEQTNYLISGAGGSELFRALHITGAVTSQTLAKIFTTQDESELAEIIKKAKPLRVLYMEEFTTELDELIAEIIAYKKTLPKNLSTNQQFYIFVFEEVFRKFFGQWITTQQQYLTVRTPFLDYNFIKTLLTTVYAGANNDFFTKNPLKRMKGQYVYADIIKKTNQKIYRQVTGKGYRPIDVRNPKYLLNLLLPFLKKRIQKKAKKTNLDNLGIISGIKANEKKIHLLIAQKQSFFDAEILTIMLTNLSPYTPEKDRDTLALSLAILYNLSSHFILPKTETHEVYSSVNRL